ncbi:MAG TPA: hypothetical protein VFH63_09510 [candidate division Zixibacteria bacterium]|nr:hypothetical protein [candidate division Zixibacteria bacterium]
MGEAGRRRLDHVVLPRRLPGLALLERYFPSPADNQLDAELGAFARPGDTVLDPWAGTGWTARRAIAHGMRAVAADPSPFAQLAAQAFLLAPEPAAIDSAFTQLAQSRRVDVPLRQHIEELYATRCATCRSPVVGDQFIWPRDADAPGRKIYRCPSCEISVGGPEERVAPVDEVDLAKLGIERPAPVVADVDTDPSADAEDDLPPAPVGLTGSLPPSDPDALGEPGEPPPPPPLPVDPPTAAHGGERALRFASTVRPDPPPQTATDVRQGPHYQQLRDRFPVLDGRSELVNELLDLYTPRNLYALQTIANKIDAEFRDPALAAVFRLALAACLLPASRLNGYPGRVASLRISGGHVRQPASRHQREVNVWRLFESAVRDVRTAIAALGRERRPARFAAGLEDLGGVSAANVLWIRCRPAVVGQYLPDEGMDLVLTAIGPPGSVDEISFEYLATSWLLGREAAETLRLEPLFGSGPARTGAAEAAALRHAMASAAGALKPDGWLVVILEGDDVDRLLSVAVAGAAAGLDLVDVIHRQSRRSGDGVTLHFHKPSAEDRLRAAVKPKPLRLGAEDGRLTYPELAEAIDRAAVSLLRNRGEPAGLMRIAAAVLLEMQRTGLLRRVAHARANGEAGETAESDLEGRLARGGGLLGSLLHEELQRDDHPSLVRLQDADEPMWWLRDPEVAEAPLADRVEWSTFSVLSTAGRLDEAGFLERIYALFPGLDSPDEELVRACLAAYGRSGDGGLLRTDDDLARRLEEHSAVIAALVDYGHRCGLRVWVSRREHDRTVGGTTLLDRLYEDERRAYLPLVVRAPSEVVGAVDAIWYVRGRLALLFEVEWTAMLGEAILRRGRRIEPTDDQARFIVFPAERTELVRLKLERSPWLRAEVERQNWHFLKWQHLQALVAGEGAGLDRLEPYLGLDPLVEHGGEQLTMFGE